MNVKIDNNVKTPYTIIHGENCSPSENTAAKEFQRYTEKIFGVTIPVLTDKEPKSEYEIIIGKTNREENNCFIIIDRKELGNDGFIIKKTDNNLFILGGEKRGTLYGVYTFLENFLGCRWYTHDVTKTPVKKEFTIPEKIDIKEIPALENRDVYWATSWDTDWSVVQKVNGCISRKIPEELGGGISYAGQFVHSFNSLIPPSEYFKEHPEYYAEINGKRKHEWAQLCLSNPEVLRLAIESVLKLFRKNPDATICSVSQNDSGEDGGYCQCEKCNAIYKEEGSQSGAVIHFVNAIADAVKDEFPNKYIDTLAYRYTRKPPKIVKPRDNVIVRLCSIECCFSHPIEECDNTEVKSMKDENFLSDLQKWSQLSKNLYIWDYTTNYKYFLAPFPNFQVLVKNIQCFIKNNARGIFEQGNQQEHKNGEFGELRAYLLAKLLWNPNADIDSHMDDFLEGYYGKGWKNIREYIDYITEKAAKNHFGIYSEPDIIINLSPEEIKKCDNLWDEAETKAKDEDELNRIKRSRLQLEFYKLICEKGEYANATTKELYDARKIFYNNFIGLGVKYLHEGDPYTDKPDFKKPIIKWNW